MHMHNCRKPKSLKYVSKFLKNYHKEHKRHYVSSFVVSLMALQGDRYKVAACYIFGEIRT